MNRSGATKYLASCRAGERLIVGGVEGGAERVDRLASIGILPGVELRVQQTRPVVVVDLDGTVLALDREIAGCVQAARVQEPSSGKK
jgi:Fe2+ transport system protein FeoA